MEVILCRMVRGSSADQRSANRRLSASFIAQGRTQITPRDRIRISKTSSLQSHRQMGVMKQDCNSEHRIARFGANAAAKPFCQGEAGAVGLSRMPMARNRRVT